MIEKIKIFLEKKRSDKLSFFEYMNLALYAPEVGYYSSNSPKIGAQGDFITAPELTVLFAEAMAVQFAQIFQEFSQRNIPINILEYGAGSGKFAIDILFALKKLGVEVGHYFILEVSAGLKSRQQDYSAKFPEIAHKISWLSALPKAGEFSGIIFANEVLDAMPVHQFLKKSGKILEQSVKLNSNLNNLGPLESLEYGEPLEPSQELLQAVLALESRLGVFPEGYCSEVNLFVRPWIQALYEILDQGAVLLIDYGYSETDYYSPMRNSGTLLSYARHRPHADILSNPGEQDITAHVDFSAVADAGLSAGFELVGYTTQGLFLANLLKYISSDINLDISPAASQHLRRLVHPEAMGNIFKVMGFQKKLEGASESKEEPDWIGFSGVNQIHQL